jgi:hypothetical protein
MKGHTTKRRKSASRALVHHTRTVYRTPKVARRRRHGKGAGGIKLTHLALAAVGIGFLTGSATPFKAIPENLTKVPGAKTFGNAAALGGVALAINYFKPNKWLRLAGIAGIAVAAVQLGTQGTSFKFVGDGGDMGDEGDMGDMEDDE